MLIDAAEAELRRQGMRDLAITVISTNIEAERLYRRRGARPYTTILVQQVQAGAPSMTPAEPPG
jgi:hypothetical protein